MLDNDTRKKIENATVILIGRGGLGVVVDNSYIITAAHCIGVSLKGDMALNLNNLVEVETNKGKIRAVPYIIEPISDIAVLGCPDGQIHQEAEAYESITESIEPVIISTQKYSIETPFDAFILTHEKSWLQVKAEVPDPQWLQNYGGTITIKHEESLQGGTSGGPIVNEEGELVAVVSQGYNEGKHAKVDSALPKWILDEISK